MLEPCQGQIWTRAFSDRLGVAFCASALAVLILITFAPALNDHLLSDSFRLVGQIDFPAAQHYFYQTSGFGRNEYRPIVLLTFAWDNLLWGDRPLGYHVTNLLLHAGNGVLLFLVFWRLTGNLLLAFSAAALFSVHPAHHSRVAWIAARDSSVCLFFLLIAWLAHLFRRTSPAQPEQQAGPWRRNRSLLWVISASAFVLALFSYEGAVAFPFVLVAMELLFARAPSWTERTRQAAGAAAPYFLLLALYLAWWSWLFRGSVGGYDLNLSLSGFGSNLYRMHYRLFHDIQHWLGLFYLLAAWCVWRHRRQYAPLLGGSVALLWLGSLPFLAVRGYADRFGFLSAAGVALFLSLCAGSLSFGENKRLRAATVVPVILLLLFAGYYTHSTGQRLREWQEAGQMAESMMMQLKALRPSFPQNATLVFDQVPPMHGNAYVFITGLRAAVRQRYRQELPNISYYPTRLDPAAEEALHREPAVFHYRYLPKEKHLVEISARLDKSILLR